MTKIRKELQALCKTLEFQLSDLELEKIESEYLEITEKLDLIRNFKVKKIKATNFVHQALLDPVLRDDHEIVYNRNDVFANCDSFDGKYVVMKNEK